MFIFNHTNSLKRVVRGFVRFALCSLILSSSFHLEGHNHSNEDGYNMCRVDCESCEPHAHYDSCEECVINRNQESFLFGVAYLNYSDNKSLLFLLDKQECKKYSVDHYSYSRPPPPLNPVEIV